MGFFLPSTGLYGHARKSPVALPEGMQYNGNLPEGGINPPGHPLFRPAKEKGESMGQLIYLDNAATTPLAPEVWQQMAEVYQRCWGNASSIHGPGREARRAVDRARRQVAAGLGAQPQEIYFTSGGSESDNWAIKGAALARKDRGRHLITSAIEHHAVLHACQWLESQGFEVTYLPVDSRGRVDPAAVEQAVRPDTILISVMTANNEIGTIQPIRQIGVLARERGILFHTDAVQAVGALPLDVSETGADLVSLSAHKFHGPKGVGALYIRQGVRLENLIHGGAQERGRRAGTENVAAIVGMGYAMERAVSLLPESVPRIRDLRDRMIETVLSRIPDARLNGDREERLPGNAHFTFPDIDGEALILRLDLMDIACSGGSACTSGTTEPSHVLQALGQPPRLSRGGLRITVGEQNTRAEIDRAADAICSLVTEMRGM